MKLPKRTAIFVHIPIVGVGLAHVLYFATFDVMLEEKALAMPILTFFDFGYN